MAAYTCVDTERWLDAISGVIAYFPETEQTLLPLFERVEGIQRNLVSRQATRDRIAERRTSGSLFAEPQVKDFIE
ncbi:hypothetical protein [Brucella cytisi]|uniref:Uncharacterized protein n=1 Tax=Brucella cytisi TaxID=407152 RepID=A0A1J6I3J8_9HYPH|nr:hypothetical protein [Brucella cytisi]OIS95119.1 hypothetical protein BLA27_03825 [Brucella cytisi]